MRDVPQWDPDDYDRQVKESRKRALQQERDSRRSPVTQREARGRGVLPRMRERPDGTWVVLFMGADGKERRRRFNTRAEAQARLDLLDGER